MEISTNNKVNDFLEDIQSISPAQFDIVVAIRDLFVSASGELVEDIKYGGLVFNLSKALIGGIYTYKQHVSIEFSHGSGFIDKASILEGTGKNRRHIKIYTIDDIAHKSSKYFIDQAVNNKQRK